jgi:hypothetical protein
VYFYTKDSSWNPNCNTLEADRPQQDCLAGCVIAQQYSFTNFISFPARKTWARSLKSLLF